MEYDALFFVDAANEVSELRTENLLERARLGRDDVHLQSTCPERRSNLETDEAGSKNHCAIRFSGGGNQRATVLQRSEVEDRCTAGHRYIKLDWRRPCREKQCTEVADRSILERQTASARVQGLYWFVEHQLNPHLFIE